MRIGPHEHPCQHCHVLTECCGDVEQNHDGWPEWVCVEFHIGNRRDFYCEACAELFARERVCRVCQAGFTASQRQVRKHDYVCLPCRMKAYQQRKADGLVVRGPNKPRRWLKAGDAIPEGVPMRSVRKNGYVELVWHLDAEHVRTYEHRLIAGFGSEVVHHVNGVKSDNRPENLEPLTRSAHASHHFAWKMKFDRAEAAERYRSGWSIRQLSDCYDAHYSTILRVLRKLGAWGNEAHEPNCDIAHPKEAA